MAMRQMGWLVLVLVAACGPAKQKPVVARSKSPLAVFMREEINRRFSQVSFLLFHADDEVELDAGPLPDPLANQAEELLAKVSLLRKWPDLPYTPEERAQFAEQAAFLEQSLAGLIHSARAGNRPETMHWFSHAKMVCERCHELIRHSQPLDMAGPTF